MKVKVVSFTILGILFFLFLTSIPAGFWQNRSAPVKTDSSILSMGEGSYVYPSSNVIADCIPNHPENLPISNGTMNVSVPENAGISQETASETTYYGSVTDMPSETVPAAGTVPSGIAPAGIAPASGTAPEDSMNSTEIPSEERPGSYPESNFLNGNQTSNSGMSTTLPKENGIQNGTLDFSASTQENAQEYWQAFFDESPMILNGQELEDGRFQNVSANSGMHIMPKESGINGRSIYGLREHFIEDGDTLPKIAARYLGDPERQVEIFELNRKILKSMDELPIGAVLLIPDRF